LNTINLNISTHQIDEQNSLAWSLNRENAQQAIDIASKTLRDSLQIDYVNGIASAKKTLGACHVWISNNESAANYCFEAISLFKSLKDEKNEAETNYILGSNFFYLSDYDTAINYYNKCYNISLKNNFVPGMADGLNGLGTVYYTTEQNEIALEKLIESENICRTHNLKNILIKVLDGLGETYINLNDYNKALAYYNDCLTIIEELTGNYRVKAFALDGLGRAYTGLKQFDKALERFNESLAIRKEIDFKFGVATTLNNIGKLYIQKNETQNAINNLTEAFELSKKISSKEGVFQASEKLAELFEQQGASKDALKFFKIFHEAKEDVRNHKSAQLLKSLELQTKVIRSQTEKDVLEERAKELENFSESLIVMRDVGQKIISNLSVATIVNTVYKNVNDLMDATGFGIGIYQNSENAIVYPLYIEGEDRFENLKFELNDTNHLTAICFTESCEIIINDFENEISKYLKTKIKPKAGKHPASLIYLPLKYKDALLGVITVQSFKLNAYNNYHINVFKNLATYTAIAIENAKLYEEQEFKILERTKELVQSKEEIERSYENNKRLSEIGREITSSLNLGNIFTKLHISIKQIMEADCFGVRLYKPEINSVEYKYEIENGKLEQDIATIPLSDENNFTVWCIRNKKDIFINDNINEFQKYVEEIRVVAGDMPNSLLFTPMMIGEKIVGVITVQSFKKFAYQPHHLDILRTLGTYTAIALENAYLYENMEEKVKQRTIEVVKQKEEIDHKNSELIKRSNQIEESLKEKEVLLKEIHHRVKNNLQIISSLLGLQSDKIKAPHLKFLFSESRSKISAIAQVHEKLYQSDDLSEVNIDDYLTSLYSSVISILEVKNTNIKFKYQKSNLLFDIDTSVPLGLILNELITNSIKYAFPEKGKDEIKVSIKKHANKNYEFIYTDNGIGFNSSTSTEGLGLNLIKLLARQMGGTFEINSEKGIKVKIIFIDTEMRKKVN
jgi:two-component sensor histidine kinase/GAF domain-containing protein/tetratricopeptide (TPR) repeat protein